MPRILIKRKKPLETSEKIERSRRWNPRNYGGWVDPYPHILGTEPEKKVYAMLMSRGIGFKFQTWFHAKIPQVGFDKWYRPDFIIPSLKVIIEVQGAYFHSQPDQIDQDAFKQAIYQQMGWKVLTWWDFEIESQGVYSLATQVPGLAYYRGAFVGEIITQHKEVRDDSAGIRKANALRKDYANQVAKIKTRKTRTKSVLSYNV